MKPASGNRHWKWTMLMILILGAAHACQLMPLDEDAQIQAETIVAETMAAVSTDIAQTQLAEEIEEAALVEEPTPDTESVEEQEQTPSPTITNTATLSVPVITVSQSTNCRTGPGKIYDKVGALVVGQEAEVIARYADSSYWIIVNPSGPGNCWLWGFYATVQGPTANLPVWDSPPTPTPHVAHSPEPTTYSTGVLAIQQIHTADLDEGVLVAGSANDLWFEVVSPSEKYLVPRNGAKMLVWGGSAPSMHDCMVASLSTNKIPLGHAAVGIYVCYETNQGRPGRFRVTGVTDPPIQTLTISFITWNIP